MDEYGLSMNLLRKFMETTRTYLELARKPSAQVQSPAAARLSLAGMPSPRCIEYCESAPA